MINETKISVIIAHSSKLIKDGLIKLINSFEKTIVIDEAEDEYDLLFKSSNPLLEIAIIDSQLQSQNISLTIKKLCELNPNIKTLLIVDYFNPDCFKINEGYFIDSVVTTKACSAELESTIYTMMNCKSSCKGQAELTSHNSAPNCKGISPIDLLTEKEIQVLVLLAKGFNSKEIASKLFRSIRTIDTHRSRVIQKLHFKGATELLKFAIENFNRES